MSSRTLLRGILHSAWGIASNLGYFFLVSYWRHGAPLFIITIIIICYFFFFVSLNVVLSKMREIVKLAWGGGFVRGFVLRKYLCRVGDLHRPNREPFVPASP